MAVSSQLQNESIPGERGKGIAPIAAQILPAMAIVSLFPAIPSLMQHFGGLRHAALLVPMILTMPALMVALFAPLAGMLADRAGRRVSFLAGMVLYVLAGLVPIVTADIWIIVASRAVLGIAEALAVTVSSALIGVISASGATPGPHGSESSSRPRAPRCWSRAASSPHGAGAGPSSSPCSPSPRSCRRSSLSKSPRRLRASTAPNTRRRPWRDALPIGALTLFASLLYYVEPLHIAQLFAQAGLTSPAIAGIVQALTTVGYVAGAVLYRQPARRPIEQHMAVSWLFMGAGLLLIGASAALPGITVGATIQQLGAGFTIPALLAWGQARLSYQQRGRGMGLWTTSFFVGTFLCPPLMTGLSDAMLGLRPAVSLAGALCLAGALVSAWRMRRETHQLRFSRG